MAVAPLLAIENLALQAFVGGTGTLYLPCLSVCHTTKDLTQSSYVNSFLTVTAIVVAGVINKVAGYFYKVGI